MMPTVFTDVDAYRWRQRSGQQAAVPTLESQVST